MESKDIVDPTFLAPKSTDVVQRKQPLIKKQSSLTTKYAPGIIPKMFIRVVRVIRAIRLIDKSDNVNPNIR